MIAEKVLKVMAQVGALGKDGLNKNQNYEYLSEEKIVGELHAACVECGLTVAPTCMEMLESYEYTTANGNPMRGRLIRVTYQLTDPADKDFILIQGIGEGVDSGDKATNKAMTAAYKYALRQAFMISTGDDPDKETPIAAAGKSQTQTKPVGKQQPKKNGQTCADCDGLIEGYTTSQGKEYTADQVAKFSVKDHGRALCRKCSWAAKEAKEASDAALESGGASGSDSWGEE